MDFGIIDTTPSHGFKVACIHSTTHTQQSARNASALKGPHPTHRSKSLTSRDWFLILEFDFFGRPAPQLAAMTRFTSSAQAHVNQKSFDMTTPNDTRSRCSRLVLRVSFARRANGDRARCAPSNCDREQKCWLANHVAAANGSPQ
jgi:hypothetical protein